MKKKILIFIGVIVLIVVALVAYTVVSDLKQEEVLKQEIVNVSNKDILTDNFEVEVKTTGDYAYVEEAVKQYYKDLSDSAKKINYYLNDEELTNILAPENLEKNRPDFAESKELLNEVRQNTTDALNKISDLCEEETIKNLLDKDKVDKYYIDLYEDLMYTDKDLKELQETKQEMDTLSKNLNIFLDKVEEMLTFLETNNNYWYIENNQIYLETEALVEEYNNLYNELNKIATENFDTNNQSNDTNITA